MTDNEKAVVEAVRERVRMAEDWSKSTGYDAHHYFDTMMDLRRLLHILTAGTEPEKPLCVNCQEPESVHGIGGYYCKEFAAPQEGD